MDDKMGRLWRDTDEIRLLVQQATDAARTSKPEDFTGGRDALMMLRNAAKSHNDKSMTAGKLLRLLVSESEPSEYTPTIRH